MLGPALLDDDRGDAIGAGASGYGVRMLVEITSRMAAAIRRGALEAAREAGARSMSSFRRKQESDDD